MKYPECEYYDKGDCTKGLKGTPCDLEGCVAHAPKQHEETIRCPECGKVQTAVVKHTVPFSTYIHTCKYCRHQIMESEWERVEMGN